MNYKAEYLKVGLCLDVLSTLCCPFTRCCKLIQKSKLRDLGAYVLFHMVTSENRERKQRH